MTRGLKVTLGMVISGLRDDGNFSLFNACVFSTVVGLQDGTLIMNWPSLSSEIGTPTVGVLYPQQKKK